MKKKLIFCILFLTITCLSGCNTEKNTDKSEKTTKKTTSNQTSDKTSKNPDHITETLSSGIKIDADVNILSSIDTSALCTYKTNLAIQDYDKSKQLFLKDKKIISDEVDEENLESLTNSPYKYCETDDNFNITSSGEDLVFDGELSTKVNYVFSDKGIDKNSDLFLTGKDLKFKKMEECKKEVDEIIKELGITVSPNSNSYTMDYQTMKTECDKINSLQSEFVDSDNSDFETVTINEDDECYLFTYQILTDGVPISMYENGVWGDGSYTSGTTVRSIYSKDGIVSFNINYQFETPEVLTEKNDGITMTQALELLDKKFNSIITEGEYTVDEISFEYIPMPEKGENKNYTLTPAYRFSLNHSFEIIDDKDPKTAIPVTENSFIVFDAITGDEIITDNGGA